MPLELLDSAAVKTTVLFCDVHYEEVIYLPLLHHCQFHFRLLEALGVVSIELFFPHVHPRQEQLSSPLGLEHPTDHGQAHWPATLTDLTGQGDVVSLGHHSEWRWNDCDIDSWTNIWNKKYVLAKSFFKREIFYRIFYLKIIVKS